MALAVVAASVAGALGGLLALGRGGPGLGAALAAAIAMAGLAVASGVRRVLVWRSQGDVLRQERERTNQLFQASLEAHASIGVVEVERAITRRAAALLDGDRARIDRSPPARGELGSRLRSTIDPDRWLIVSPRRDGRPFEAKDERALEVLVATTAAAFDNALLHQQTQGERQQLADVVGSSSDGIFSFSPTGDHLVTSWNPAMARITDRPAEAAVGVPCAHVFPAVDESGEPVTPAAMLGLESPPGQGTILEITACGGERRWLECRFSPMAAGGCVVVARDISAQREVDELKADFLATVSHELRTPLTPIQGFLQTLMRDDAAFDDEERNRFYEVMLRQSERLERLIKDLLDATSLQDKAHLFFPEEVDWAVTAGRVVELFRRQEPSRSFLLEAPPALPLVVVDEQRAEQVLSNLLTNAVKYSPADKPVVVRVSRRGGEVVTTVTDGGPGIAPGEREKVFERFTRLGDHLTRTVGGAGLGLFIARRLVEGMGGSIHVDNAPEGGAAFSFTLPASAGARMGQAAAVP
jgi:nitrogen-specific signal transduction histidine kinase